MNSATMPAMYPKPLLLGIAMFTVGLWAMPTYAAVTVTESWTINAAIPDNDPVGVADTRIISTEIVSIDSFIVTLTLSETFAMWNGDYYVHLTHGSGFSVLLNRTGRTALDSVGYGDVGFNVTFDDAAGSDIHLYRETTNPAGGILTGTWQPDARATDPDLVLDSSPRTASFSSFQGLDPNGEWTLFVADLAAGGEASLESWSLTITGSVPEPSSALLAALSACALAFRRSRS